jgi:hypothetical protein
MEIHHQFKKAKELLGNLQFNPEVFRVSNKKGGITYDFYCRLHH